MKWFIFSEFTWIPELVSFSREGLVHILPLVILIMVFYNLSFAEQENTP